MKATAMLCSLLVRNRLYLVLVLCLLCGGCGGSSGGGFQTPGGEAASAPPSGAIRVRMVLQRAVPNTIVSLRFTGLSGQGVVRFGPITMSKAAEIELSPVPTDVTTLVIEYLDAQGVVRGLGSNPVSVVANQVTTLSDPSFDDVSLALRSLEISPSSLTLAAGLTQQFIARGSLVDGGEIDVTSAVTWSSSASPTATITAGGLATAGSPGTAVITATLGETRATSQLTVTSATLSGLTVTTGTTLAKGLTRQLTAVGTFSDGSSQNLSQNVTWQSSDPSIVSVTPTGLAKAEKEGTATLRAAAGDLSGTAELVVTAPTLQSLAVTPANPVLFVGSSDQFTARGTYSDGTSLDLTGQVAWTSATPTTATVSTDGRATAVAPGTTQITASFQGVTAFTSLTAITAGGAPPPPAPTLTSLNLTDGSEGDVVVLTGTNFTGATAVTFGPTAAKSFTVDSASQITATVPAGTVGVKSVTVTTPGGTSGGQSFLYDFVIGSADTFNTDTGVLSSLGVAVPGWDNASKTWVVPAGFRVSADLTVSGGQPFRLTSTRRIRVEATIDARGGEGGSVFVSARRTPGAGGTPGPGGYAGGASGAVGLGPGAGGAGQDNSLGGSGGGGGGAGHSSDGNPGGNGDDGSLGGDAGRTYASIPGTLLGGSGGGGGGSQEAVFPGGAGGGGGGAVSLTAASTLTVSGTGRIDCSGGRGGQTANTGGAGGGGAGGSIVLTAASKPIADPANLVVSGGLGGVLATVGGRGADGRVELSPAI